MKVALNLDDFSVVNNRLDLLLKLKEHFPNFKVSMFTIPFDEPKDFGPYRNRKRYLKEIKKHLDWIQIIPHGFLHDSSREMKDMSYDVFLDVLINIKAVFDYDGLPFVKGFKAPHWNWSEGVIKALDDVGWWGAVLRDKPTPSTKRFYKYTHTIDEFFWESDLEVLKLHGHIYGTKNDFEANFSNLLKLPLSTQWHFVTDYLEEK